MNLFSFIRVGKTFTQFVKSETKKHVFFRYLFIVLIILGYFFYTIHQFGTQNGILVTFLTWSFLVFCTPIADAGFLIDFPVRLLTKLRMIYSEMIVWGIAAILNTIVILTNPEIYQKTIFLQLFYKILINPFPFWGIIILSGIGTFFSIYFGDELMDVTKHKHRVKYRKHINKHRIVVSIFIIVMIIILYNFLLKSIGINLPLF